MHGEIEDISQLKLNDVTWTRKQKLHPFQNLPPNLANLWPHLDGSIIYQVLFLESFEHLQTFNGSIDCSFQFSTFTPLKLNIEPKK